LAETGFVEGRNVAVEHRWSYGSGEGPALAADLLHRQVAVIEVVTTVFR
jgi:putative tryptophan/tyrosine transport system substrate-binding protein